MERQPFPNSPHVDAASRISDILLLVDSDYKWVGQITLVTLSALIGLALLPLYLSPLDFAWFILSIIFIALGFEFILLMFKRMSWMGYSGILLISLSLSSLIVVNFLGILPGPAESDWTALFAIIGSWLVLPFHLFACRLLLEINTIRLQIETLYFRTISGQIPSGTDPITRLGQIWHPYWRKRVWGSIWQSSVLFWRHRRFLRSIKHEQVESLLASWLIEGYPEDLESFAKRKGVTPQTIKGGIASRWSDLRRNLDRLRRKRTD